MGTALSRLVRGEFAAENDGAPTDKAWYHGDIADKTAENRLALKAGRNGNYLVYDYRTVVGTVSRGNYTLLVAYEKELCRLKIRRQDGRYVIEQNHKHQDRVVSYRRVKQLIKAHRGLTGKPLRLKNGGTVTLTREYVSRSER